MIRLSRLLALLMVLCTLCSTALAASATPTPPPVQIDESVLTPPEEIQNFVDIAYGEWQELNGKRLKKVNKYTEWRGKGIGFGWCGGFITWCMMEAGIPMEELEYFKDNGDENDFMTVDGLMHVKEASVGKIMRGYQIMDRTTHVPQKGYLLVYGCDYNKTIHIALVSDVEQLGEGKYRITTIEGNMASRVKMFVHDYDMNAENWKQNLSEVPADERTQEETDCFDYTLPKAKPSDSASKKAPYYVNCFLMTWVPEVAE